ncbi:hypothetical protein [Streptomonospora arabica]|uniref:Cytotoxic translational repressor of toxin-antitoxin stability system n=1 Tax=Streptomonospora arabica TaxID=412417 RepID=A0ABV9SJM4_9ACTN
MKFRTSSAFDRQLLRLPEQQQRLFRRAVYEHFLPALKAGALSGDPPWPLRLRIHRLHQHEIYTLTWNFSGPDGRATFHFEKDEKGDTVLVWRRIGDHSIYKDP